jgi:type IV pilus assembly protein PilA
MAVDWYYADAHNQQQGPVAASTLAGYYRTGVANVATLVWREGLANWVPLRDVAAQLGLIILNAPDAPRPSSGPPAGFVKPRSGASSAVIIVVVLLVVAIPVLAILAAIALPAYQDYTIRAKVSQGLIVTDGLKIAVAEYKLEHEKCPLNGDPGFGSAESYATQFIAAINVGPLKKTGECGIQLTFGKTGASTLDGKKLTLALDEGNNWRPSSDIPKKFLPISLRNAME